MTTDPATPDHPDGVRFALVAIPLSRPDVSAFIRDWRVPARGARAWVLEQRPPAHIRDWWLRQLADLVDDPDQAATVVVATDEAMSHLGSTRTDRLVPRDFLDDERYLERNLGGWAPLWFDALGLDRDASDDDPVLRARHELVDYGDRIRSAGVPGDLVAERLGGEFPDPAATLRRGAVALARARSDAPDDLVPHLVDAARGKGPLGDVVHPLLAHDELIEQLYRLELARRQAVADDRADVERRVVDRQQRFAEDLGIELLLKGEYIMGRHRRSTILLAEGLGVVTKQPAPEPEHEIELAAHTYGDSEEHWPHPEGGGRMVTARADIAQVVGSTAVERLDAAFGRDVQFSVALGLSVEPFEQGPTLKALALERHDELTAERYDEILVHQLACEELGIDNPDWHAANFMVTRNGLVHVDWGAAQPIPPDADNAAGARTRLDQVRQLAWSFQDPELAERTLALHERATADAGRVERLRTRARALVS